jgi:putative heme-binding domain-containing protein
MSRLQHFFTSRLRRVLPAVAACAIGLVWVSIAEAAGARLELKKGDHVAILGNTLADRMQHDGWLEAHLYSRFSDHELVVRNLGFSGDELTLRLRSADFGSPDSWLTKVRADVIFAFFGSNEAYAGKNGLAKFKADLRDFCRHTLDQKYNGKTAPRLVLFSPIAHENLKSKNLPDGAAHNVNLALYTEAMAEVADAFKIPFVDIFHPTRDAYLGAPQPLTFNGIHLTEAGGYTLAHEIDKALFPEHVNRSIAGMEKIRQAVLDKNFYWFNRYRTVDGYSIFGGRAGLEFTNNVNHRIQTNREVAQREMEVLDVMTANRDPRIWAVAKGGDLKVDDSNTPPFIPVISNKPGNGPNGEHLFLGGEEAITKMTLGKGMKINLFASEEQFPLLAKPVQMAWDAKGRLWVAVWPTYPHWKPKEEMNDKILIFEDTDADGRADKVKVFADKLHCPTGFELVNGGVLVAAVPELLFLQDTDGDDKADVRRSVLSGLDSADTHHSANSFQLDPGGALYFQEGTFHHTQVETPYGPPVRVANGAVFRYEAKAQKFDVYVTYGFANPHGHVFDHWGQDVVVDGTGAVPYHGTLFSGHLDFPQKHGGPPTVYPQRTRPCPGVEILSSRHFPESMQGNLLVPNVIGFQGILRYRLDDKGASIAGTEEEPILSSTDPNFRPSDVEMGPDGAIYFLDWQNPIIGHMQHNLRDPSRDQKHGRIYRVTYDGRPLLKPELIAGQPIPRLLDLLKSPEDRTRYRAKIELSGRDQNEVDKALDVWVAALDKNDPEHEHFLTEALWVHQFQNVVDADLLKRVLKSPDFRARAAGTRVLCYWRDRLPDAIELLKALAADPYPRVRLEAIRSASFFDQPEALEVALISAEQPTDVYLDYLRTETMTALEPIWKKAAAEGRQVKFISDVGARFFLKGIGLDELLKMPKSRAVDLELLFRKGVRDDDRRAALADLAKRENQSPLRVLLDAIKAQDEEKGAREESVVFDLVRLLTGQPAADLAGARKELEGMASGARQPITRELGFVALIAADKGVDNAWTLASSSVKSLADLLHAMPLVGDPNQRAALYPKVAPLLDGLPASLGGGKPSAKATSGRFVRIELKGRKTLTLAEVEVISDGRNIARDGKATQKNTASGGVASRAIDGNKSPAYGDNGQTHTEEGTLDPWWELDLGSDRPIESIKVYNRGDGNLNTRLRGFTVRLLDSNRHVVFEKTNQPTPLPSVAFEVGGGGGPEGTIRRAAMAALTSVRGQEGPTFRALAKFVRSGDERLAAIQALQRIPTAEWPADEAAPLLASLTSYLKSIPTADRTSTAALDALQLGDSLASLLPRDQARAARRALGNLGVRIIRLGTVPDQMLFDRDRIVVEAGKPVEIIFENNDLMPHNFVVTQPGALEEVGLLGESSATESGALERNYVPRTPKILFSTRLLQPREGQKLDFTAPSVAGVYPYVCTYPGHWRRMFGALYVVSNLEDYLADPEAYLAAHPVTIKDELIKSNRPRKEWKLEDLASEVEHLDGGRSFANGKSIFQVANCVACHRLNGVGEQIGQDLAQLDPKFTRVDVLKNILDPSFKIDEKYQTYLFDTVAGKVVTGMILEENADTVKVIENPIAKTPPVILRKTEIVERKKSPSSIMPKGLLDKLTREEILDLMSYVIAKGDANHPLFKAGGAGHNHGH